MNMFTDLLDHLIFDVHKMKKVLEEFHKIDVDASKEGFPKDKIEQLDGEVQNELHQINVNLRALSDKMGALTRE